MLATTPLAAVHAGALDPLSPALLRSAAHGWPLLLHASGGRPLTPLLAGILHADQHYEPFSGASELRAALDALRDHPDRFARRCARTREHLLHEHTYAQRLRTLVHELGLQWA